MTSYHPDVQRAYESHCADGYVVPDDETGPQEATDGAVRDFPCCDAPRDGAGLREAMERRLSVEALVAGALVDFLDATDSTAAAQNVVEGIVHLLADPAEAERRENVAKAWAVRWMEERDDARGALDETLDDLTRTLARAEKAEARERMAQQVIDASRERYEAAEARAAELEAAWSEACEVAGQGADEVAAKDEEIARLREEVQTLAGALRAAPVVERLADKVNRVRDLEAERDRARDTAAALEAENARLSTALREARVAFDAGRGADIVRGIIDNSLAGRCPTCSPPVRETVGLVCQTCGTDYAALSDTTGEATR